MASRAAHRAVCKSPPAVPTHRLHRRWLPRLGRRAWPSGAATVLPFEWFVEPSQVHLEMSERLLVILHGTFLGGLGKSEWRLTTCITNRPVSGETFLAHSY